MAQERQRWLRNIKGGSVKHYGECAIKHEFIIECDRDGNPVDPMQYQTEQQKLSIYNEIHKHQESKAKPIEASKVVVPELDEDDMVDVILASKGIDIDKPLGQKLSEFNAEEKEIADFVTAYMPLKKPALIKLVEDAGIEVSKTAKSKKNKRYFINKLMEFNGLIES